MQILNFIHCCCYVMICSGLISTSICQFLYIYKVIIKLLYDIFLVAVCFSMIFAIRKLTLTSNSNIPYCYLDVWNLLTRTQRKFCNISQRIMSKKWRIVLRGNKCIRHDDNIKEKRHEINRPLTTGCPCVGIWWGLIQQYFPVVICRVFIQTAI